MKKFLSLCTKNVNILTERTFWLKHLKYVFHKINGNCWLVVDQISTSIQENISKSKSSEYYPGNSK